MWLKIKNDLINLNGVELIQIRDYKINIIQGNKVYTIMEGSNLTNEEFNRVKENLLEKLKDKIIVLLEEKDEKNQIII